MGNRARRVLVLSEPAESGQDETRRSAEDVREAIAAQVREAYIAEYRQRTGKHDYGKGSLPFWDGCSAEESPYGQRRPPVWPRIADVVISLGADPRAYIQAQFRARKRIPRPNQLYGAEARKIWETYKEVRQQQIQRELISGFNQLQMTMLSLVNGLGWDRVRAAKYAVNDRMTKASPLVRYCFAEQESLPILPALKDAATREYMLQPDLYDRLLGSRIPTVITEEGRRLRRQLIGS